MRIAALVAVVLSVVGSALSARILAVLPFPGKSHHIFHGSVLKALTDRGHEVVEYGPFPPKRQIPNYTYVQIQTMHERSLQKWTFARMEKDMLEDASIFGLNTLTIWEFLYDICDGTFKDESIKKLLLSKEHFDLVITTSTFGQESMLVFGHKFSAPTITLQGFSHSATLNREAGNALSIATIADSMSFAFTDQMTFKERMQNFISVSLTLFQYYNSHLPRQNDILQKYYQVDGTPSVAQMAGNVSLTLVNSHPTVQYPQPYTPNIVPIGGITITSERIALPQDVQKFMDDAKEGVIYFSFGTAVPAYDLPKHILHAFINAFKRLNQKVLWKIELENLPGLSDNVMVTKWVPQLGVLAHPNCVAFITHGGLFSLHEAMHAGVPLVTIPFFADQPFNARFGEHRGIGVALDYRTLTEDSLRLAIKTVVENPKYKENAKRWSRIFRDRPLSPADTAVFWVEYVLRHGGAHHLRPAATQLSWYQLALLDIAAVVLAVLIAVFITFYLLLRMLFSFLLGQKKKNQSN